MESHEFDEEEFFGAIERSGARALLIGRRALIAIGLPLVTFDYDYWVHIDDIERFNAALEALEHYPSVPPEEARKRGRYSIENGEHIDVMVARSKGTGDAALTFDEAWASREKVVFTERVSIAVPRAEDLVRTKRWASRNKDLADIQMIEAVLLQKKRGGAL
ncbi:MAG: hypothetical protein IPG50_07355 [Myxococcales bacterium]|nr:hypothetical protein [Myxococcales bacterium]